MHQALRENKSAEPENTEPASADWEADPAMLFAVIEARLKRPGGSDSYVGADQLAGQSGRSASPSRA